MRPPSSRRAAAFDPDQARDVIENFLKTSRRPILVEPGVEPIALLTGSYVLEVSARGLVIEVWDDARNVRRRVVEVRDSGPGRLELVVEKFGGRTGTVVLADAARSRNHAMASQSGRLVLREQFRRALARQFGGWRIAELSTGTDLEHSLSPVYPRALLRKGTSAWAALAAAPGASDQALTAGLIWLDYLRGREKKLAVEGLALFLPAGETVTTCLRLRWLNPLTAQFRVFGWSPDFEQEIDARDHGNLDTGLGACMRPIGAGDMTRALAAESGVECVEPGDGSLSFRVRGFEFARLAAGQLRAGIDNKVETDDVVSVIEMVRTLARLRSPQAADRRNPLYLCNPESWLESQVRSFPQTIDATLLPSPIYGQVPAFSGVDRSVIDLLAITRAGRLAVIEVKATEDIHLPMQALDYWMRVRHHALAGDFGRSGYFPGVEVTTEAPRLLLVAPALRFHPAVETVLAYLAPEIEVERIGVCLEWQQELRVLFRARGLESPASALFDGHPHSAASPERNSEPEPERDPQRG